MKNFSFNSLFSTNFKDIGTLYFFFGAFSGIIGTLFSVIMRMELVSPGGPILNGNFVLFGVKLTVLIAIFYLQLDLLFYQKKNKKVYLIYFSTLILVFLESKNWESIKLVPILAISMALAFSLRPFTILPEIILVRKIIIFLLFLFLFFTALFNNAIPLVLYLYTQGVALATKTDNLLQNILEWLQKVLPDIPEIRRVINAAATITITQLEKRPKLVSALFIAATTTAVYVNMIMFDNSAIELLKSFDKKNLSDMGILLENLQTRYEFYLKHDESELLAGIKNQMKILEENSTILSKKINSNDYIPPITETKKIFRENIFGLLEPICSYTPNNALMLESVPSSFEDLET